MPPPEDKNKKDKNAWVQIGNYASLGFMLPACIVVGYLMGLGLDHLFQTTYLRIVFLILGIVAGFVEVIRIVTKNAG